MKILLLLFATPVFLLMMCLYFWLTGNLTIPKRVILTEQEYCARESDTDMRYLEAKCLKYYLPK